MVRVQIDQQDFFYISLEENDVKASALEFLSQYGFEPFSFEGDAVVKISLRKEFLRAALEALAQYINDNT